MYNLNSTIFGKEMYNLFSKIFELGENARGQFLPINPAIGNYPDSYDPFDEKGAIIDDIALVTRWGRDDGKIQMFYNTGEKGFIRSPYWELLGEKKDEKITIFSSFMPLWLEAKINRAICLLTWWQKKSSSMTLRDVIEVHNNTIKGGK